ncbi:ribonuclease P protein component [Kordiimonas laminariae]|uniref:ribonuclease P protein component n=1 Tax=Kordiimonas laminariae TaxID=2917717 RepID=UPI001FF1CA3E|nr:ribonuclease P protein component [Kordiimonas laminariae]MCK0069348.1 ribonuclease P protein component [Kordiimonas laminariae]
MVDSAEKLVRIKKRPEYLAVSSTRRRWVTPSFILQAKPPVGNDTETPPRAGFTASKKVGNAVKRSKAKRRIREAARLVVPGNGQTGWDYVFVCRECMTDYPFEKLCSDIKWALAKLASGADLKTKPKKQKRG